MMFLAKTAPLLLAVVLCGCVSEGELAMRDQDTCLSWGVPFGSEAYANCMVLLRQTGALEAERDSARLHAIGAALQGFGDGYRGSGGDYHNSEGDQIYRDAVRDSMQRASQGVQSTAPAPFNPARTCLRPTTIVFCY